MKKVIALIFMLAAFAVNVNVSFAESKNHSDGKSPTVSELVQGETFIVSLQSDDVYKISATSFPAIEFAETAAFSPINRGVSFVYIESKRCVPAPRNRIYIWNCSIRQPLC